jgi:hypothetical protein
MEEGWICGFVTTLGTAAVLVYFISDGSEEGWIGGFAAQLKTMASIVLASIHTLGTAAVLVSFISNGSEEGNRSDISTGFDIEGWICAITAML